VEVAAVPLYTDVQFQADLKKTLDNSVNLDALVYSHVAGRDGSVGYVLIDRSGKVRLATRYCVTGPFSDGLAPVGTALDHGSPIKCGYIDQRGNLAIPPHYDQTFPFVNGLAEVRKGRNKYGVINPKGEYVVKPEFSWTELESSSQGRLAVWHGPRHAPNPSDALTPVAPNHDTDTYYTWWGYADAKGTIVIKPGFVHAWPFSEGLAAVEVLTWTVNPYNPARIVRHIKGGYIDSTGGLVIPPWFDVVLPFQNGLAPVYEGTFHGFIDRTGKYVWRAPDYTYYLPEATQ